jgi:hypothetical protein
MSDPIQTANQELAQQHHIDLFFDNKYLKAGDCYGFDRVYTIKKVEVGSIGKDDEKKQRKPIIHFEEIDKPLVCNKTNARRIAALYGPITEKWLGKKISIKATTCEMAGEEVECLRVCKERPE